MVAGMAKIRITVELDEFKEKLPADYTFGNLWEIMESIPDAHPLKVSKIIEFSL